MVKFLGTAMAATLLATSAFAMDEATQLEFMGMQQRFARITQLNEQLLTELRDSQRKIDHLYKINEEQDRKYNDLVDQILKLENVEIANLHAGQKGLYDQIPAFTWGQGMEDCPKIGSKHQQIEMVKSEDKTQTLRFLCFDGKAIHLSTEINTPPR